MPLVSMRQLLDQLVAFRVGDQCELGDRSLRVRDCSVEDREVLATPHRDRLSVEQIAVVFHVATHATIGRLSLALLALYLAPGLSARAADKVELKTVKYAGLADAVKQARGKIVVVDFWAEW